MKKTAQILFVLAFVGSLLAVPGAIFFRGTDNAAAYYENRALETWTGYTQEQWLEGGYSQGVELWLSDHIPLRESIMKCTAWWEMEALQKPVVNDIIVGETLLPFNAFGQWDLAYLEPMAQTAVANHLPILDLLDQWDGTFLYVGIPLQNSYFAQAYPDYTASRDWHIEAMTTLFASQAAEQGLPFLNMMDVFVDMGKPDAFYARSDHHYTYQGAYVTYGAIMAYLKEETSLQLPVLQEGDFSIEAVEGTFLGSRNRKIYGLWQGEESLYTGTLKEEIPFTRYDNGVEVAPTLYTVPEAGYVTYDTYMGGDKGETWIQTNREELPNLLIFGDSFTNPLETMLYTGFNETRSLDLRYYTQQGILSYLAEYQPDVVLCIRDDHSYLLSEGNGTIAP